MLITVSTFLSFSVIAQEKTLARTQTVTPSEKTQILTPVTLPTAEKTQTVTPVTLPKAEKTQIITPVKTTTTTPVRVIENTTVPIKTKKLTKLDTIRLQQQKLDTDGDGIPDQRDLDDDNDGIPDKIEILQHTKNLINIENNLFTDFDYGSFGFSSGEPDQSPATDPYPDLWNGGKYNNFYSLGREQYSYIANAVTPRSKTQHASAVDPVYGETGQFFTSVPYKTTPVTTTTISNLLVGATYELSLWAANPQLEGNQNEIKVRTNDVVILETGPLAISSEALPWTKYTGTMLATSDSTTMGIGATQAGGDGNDFYLDNIELNLQTPDFDADGIADHLDPDSDNDGILDSRNRCRL